MSCLLQIYMNLLPILVFYFVLLLAKGCGEIGGSAFEGQFQGLKEAVWK